MGKPRIGNKLPVLKIKEFESALTRNGFKADEDNHHHIQYVNKEGIKVTVMKGRNDIHPLLLRTIIREISTKMKIPETEVIEKLFEVKTKNKK